MFIVYLKSNESLIIGEQMFKWNGKSFTCYKWNDEEKTWELAGDNDKPIVKDLGVHKIAIYMKKDVGIRVMVYSEYKNQNDYVDYPIMYDNGTFGWNNPERVPKYVQGWVKRIMSELRDAKVL